MERLVFLTVTCFFLLSFIMHTERVYNPGIDASIPSVGEQIAEARLKKGYTQAELAQLLHVSIYSIECVENNKALSARGLLAEIQKVLDCDLIMDGPYGSADIAMKH